MQDAVIYVIIFSLFCLACSITLFVYSIRRGKLKRTEDEEAESESNADTHIITQMIIRNNMINNTNTRR